MKKSLKLLLSAAACTLLAVILAVTAFSARKLGDVDDKAGISVTDARLVLRFAVNLEKPANDEIKAAADVDRDGSVTVKDARAVLRAAVNLEKLPDEPAVKEDCKHEFVATPVMDGESPFTVGKHQLKCKKCGVVSGAPVDCTLGDIVYEHGLKPSCSRSVKYTQECSVCHGKIEDVIKKLPHKYTGRTEIVTPAECTKAGEKRIYCEVCETAFKKVILRPLGHVIPDGSSYVPGEALRCTRCNEELKPEKFDYNDNEFLTYAKGKYYYTGTAKTWAGSRYEYSDIEFAVNPGKSIFMKMPFDDSTEIGYLAYVDGKKTKKFFHTFYEAEKKNYYFELSDAIIKMIAGSDNTSDMSFPDPKDAEFQTVLDNADLKNADKSIVFERTTGKLCTLFTFKDVGLRVYMDGKKLVLIEKINATGFVTDATYFDMITPDIPKFMYTTDGEVLRGVTGLIKFANLIGITQ